MLLESDKVNYLTEEILGNYLYHIFDDYTICHDRAVPESNERFRLDFRIEELKLIVEFDGYQHFTNNKCIVQDRYKDGVLKGLGYTIIRIPYFIQFTEEVLIKLFMKYVNSNFNFKEIESNYSHGFISKKCTLPAEFTELGYELFLDYIDYFNVRNKVYDTLSEKLKENKYIHRYVYFYKELEGF